MLWLVGPLVATSASVVLLSGCAKGREDGKKGGPKSAKAAASSRSQKKSTSSKKEGASKRSARSVKSAKNPSAKVNLNKPPKTPLDKNNKSNRSKRSNRSARSASKSSKSNKSGSEKKPVTKKGLDMVSRDKKQSSMPVDNTQDSALSAPVPVVAVAPAKAAPTLAKSEVATGIEKKQLPVTPVPTTKIEAVNLDGGSRKELRLEPAELRWTPVGGIQNVSIFNCGTVRKAIKVKCSDNTLYRVNPVLSIIEPGMTARIDILRQNGTAKHDKIVFVSADIPSHSTDVKDALVKAGPNTEMMVLPLIATAI